MNVDGWAYQVNEKEKAKASVTNAAQFALKYGGFIEVDNVVPGYAHKMVTGHFTKELNLTAKEKNYLLAYLDNGNLCFGGRITATATTFSGKIYTD